MSIGMGRNRRLKPPGRGQSAKAARPRRMHEPRGYHGFLALAGVMIGMELPPSLAPSVSRGDDRDGVAAAVSDKDAGPGGIHQHRPGSLARVQRRDADAATDIHDADGVVDVVGGEK